LDPPTEESKKPGPGDRLNSLLLRLSNDKRIVVGIRERVISTRVVAELGAARQTPDLPDDEWRFLLRARLTPVLAKSADETLLVRRAFDDAFRPSEDEPVEPPPDVVATSSLRPREISGTRKLTLQQWAALVTGVLMILAAAAIAIYLATRNPSAPPEGKTTPPGPVQVDRPPSTDHGDNNAPLTQAEIDALFRQLSPIIAGRGVITTAELARGLAGPLGVPVRPLMGRLERHLSRPLDQSFDLSAPELISVIEAMAEISYPGRAVAINNAGAATLVNTLRSTGPSLGPTPLAPMPEPSERIVISPWISGAVTALPLLAFALWIFRRRKRLKDYLRRRTPERPPLLHDLVVHAPEIIAQETNTLTRAALRLGRSRESFSRQIDIAATVTATAEAAGSPRIVYAIERTSPEYLVLISTFGEEDHSARRLDRLTADLAAQNLSVVRYFIAHDANLCFETWGGLYYRLDELAARYPDHRLIFLGSGDQLLSPRSYSPWPWAEDLTTWQRRAFLTPRPQEEWGPRELELARLFELPPLPATTDGMMRLAEFFERQDAPFEQFRDLPDTIRRSWNVRPLRWLSPAPLDEASSAALDSELRNYFVNGRGESDEPGFWWLAACAVYPAVRWDLTVYLGLELRTVAEDGRLQGGLPLYNEERALRLAALPWFRQGFMPNWLRAQLVTALPPGVLKQAASLLRDLLERAVHARGEAYDSLRLRIAIDRPDPNAMRPERDEIFIDALAKADPLDFGVPRNFREFLSGIRDSFLAREWAGLATCILYAIATPFLVPWPSDGPLAAGAFLPLLFLPLAFASIFLAPRAAVWARGHMRRLLID
jgi:hypothetical protein